MTQEELDALISQDNLQSIDLPIPNNDENVVDAPSVNLEEGESVDEENLVEYKLDKNTYKARVSQKWPPPPPTEEHKVVHQLDDVTKDSELKMTEIFDHLEAISSACLLIEKGSKKINDYIKSQQELFTILNDKFPNIKSFAKALEDTKEALINLKKIKEGAMDSNDATMQAMDIMQYQDIHRQKIERVINVMRALTQYMNSLFEGRIDDSRRVSSAHFIAGDEEEDLASKDDIEALIASFGNR